MNLVKIAKKIPGVKRLWNIYKKNQPMKLSTEAVFSEIFQKNSWGDKDSVSGHGSNLIQTGLLRGELQTLITDLKVSTILDIACGDFYWMRELDFQNINYIGADIVRKLILQNQKKYEKENICFLHIDLIKDDLPKADFIICRDCLVHFSFNDIYSALKNICRSKSTYLLSTTFTARKNNYDIITGEWRTLNLVRPPFNLPEPIRLINEGCTEGDGLYTDKSLGLWKIEDIIKSLQMN